MKRHEESLSVRSYDADHVGRLKPSSLFNYFQEAAWHHAEVLGFGYKALLSHNLFWVISRIRLEWDHPLYWGDELTIETWPKGIATLFALRDFVVRSSDGVEAVRATSSWLTLDLESKRPRRPDRVMDTSMLNADDHAIEELPAKLTVPDDLSLADTRRARYSDLDVNQHVNNARYVDWLFDALPLNQDAQTVFRRLNVQFTGEARYGAELEVHAGGGVDNGGVGDGGVDNGATYAAIVNGANGVHVCDARVSLGS
ncbi:MAG: acyl-[acyl-carrier-protein] thioesterase [Spirochaetota bacterium]